MTKNNSQPVNMLYDLHTTFSQLPLNFRELVMEECKWSCPTYYRKIRAVGKPDENRKDGFIPALSNAEKEAILRKANAVVLDMVKFLDGFRDSKND